MPLLDSIKDPKNRVWVIAAGGIGLGAVFLLMSRGSSSGNPIGGQSSDITGSLGDLEAALQALLGNKPGGGTSGGGSVVPPTGFGSRPRGAHSNVSPSVGTLPKTNPTSHISTVAAPLNTAPAATTIKTGGITPSHIATAQLNAVVLSGPKTGTPVSTLHTAVLSGPKTGGFVAKATSIVLGGPKTGTPVSKLHTVVLSGPKTGKYVPPATSVVLSGPKTGTPAPARPATIASGTTRSFNAARDNPY